MASFNFKPQFIEPIRERRKVSTIRGSNRKVSVGERLHLFTGPRFRPEKLGTAEAVWVSAITMDFESRLIIIPGRQMSSAREVDAFAADEGFADFDELVAFFRKLYATPAIPMRGFTGTLVKWGQTFTPRDTAP